MQPQTGQERTVFSWCSTFQTTLNMAWHGKGFAFVLPQGTETSLHPVWPLRPPASKVWARGSFRAADQRPHAFSTERSRATLARILPMKLLAVWHRRRPASALQTRTDAQVQIPPVPPVRIRLTDLLNSSIRPSGNRAPQLHEPILIMILILILIMIPDRIIGHDSDSDADAAHGFGRSRSIGTSPPGPRRTPPTPRFGL